MFQFCKKCLMPSSRPRIGFNPEGICNGCLNAEQKNHVDWAARGQEFLDLIAAYKSTDGSWDCVVPWSGGKDSSAIAWRLKFDYGLNPLLVTFSPMIPSEIAQHNREQMLKAGFDHLLVRPNQQVARHLAHRFFVERGNPKVAWDAGVNTIPLQVAVRYRIALVFYAEHGESEYGGKVRNEESKKIRDFTEVIEHQIGDDPRNWVDDKIGAGDLNPYHYPDRDAVAAVGVKALYFAYFHRWDVVSNYELIAEKIDFKTVPWGRSEGTFTSFDSLDDKIDDLYYYLQFIKFGFGRAVRDASRQIQNGRLTRAQGLELAQRYDGEVPGEHIDATLDFLGLSRSEFEHIVDLHRNPEIWTIQDNEWHLRNALR